MRTLKVVLQRI